MRAADHRVGAGEYDDIDEEPFPPELPQGLALSDDPCYHSFHVGGVLSSKKNALRLPPEHLLRKTSNGVICFRLGVGRETRDG